MTFSVHGHPCHRTGYQQCHGSRDINLNRDINVTVQLRHIHVMENTLKVMAIRVQF